MGQELVLTGPHGSQDFTYRDTDSVSQPGKGTVLWSLSFLSKAALRTVAPFSWVPERFGLGVQELAGRCR